MRVIEGTPAGQPFVALYMSMVDEQWEVRTATSTDLLTWTFARSLLANADMPSVPHASAVAGSEWILLAHEQWRKPKSRSPLQLGFKLYA